MKARIFPLLLVLMITLAACGKAPAATEPGNDIPTLPSVPTEKTPLEILTAAVDKTKAALSCSVEYGKQEDAHAQSVTADTPFDTEMLYAEIEDFPTNENLLADFCSQPLRAIPSNDGTIRYELSSLTLEALAALMYGEERSFDGFTEATCTAAIVVDADGCFSRLEFVIQNSLSGTVTWFLSVRQIQLPE